MAQSWLAARTHIAHRGGKQEINGLLKRRFVYLSTRMKHRLWWLRQRSSYLAWNGNGICQLISNASVFCIMCVSYVLFGDECSCHCRRHRHCQDAFSVAHFICVGFIYYAIATQHFDVMQNGKMRIWRLRNENPTKWMRITTATSSWKKTKKEYACKRLANGAHYSSFIKCTGASDRTRSIRSSLAHRRWRSRARARHTTHAEYREMRTDYIIWCDDTSLS